MFWLRAQETRDDRPGEQFTVEDTRLWLVDQHRATHPEEQPGRREHGGAQGAAAVFVSAGLILKFLKLE